MERYAIGVDIGGSHISSVALDLNRQKMIPESFASNKVDNKETWPNIIKCWKDTILRSASVVGKENVKGVGFAMPGPFDYKNGIALFNEQVAKYENLYGINIGEELKTAMGLSPDVAFRFINDATSFAMGEAWLGKSKLYARSIAITLGTGFGSAFIDDGIPVIDRPDVPQYGNMWYIPFKEGIADDYFSTRWFLNGYFKRTGKNLSGVKELTQLADSQLVESLFYEFGTNLGTFLNPWIVKFNAPCLVIGGNIANAYPFFQKAFNKALKEKRIEIAIHLSELGEEAAMTGSARLIDEDFWTKIKDLYNKM